MTKWINLIHLSLVQKGQQCGNTMMTSDTNVKAINKFSTTKKIHPHILRNTLHHWLSCYDLYWLHCRCEPRRGTMSYIAMWHTWLCLDGGPLVRELCFREWVAAVAQVTLLQDLLAGILLMLTVAEISC